MEKQREVPLSQFDEAWRSCEDNLFREISEAFSRTGDNFDELEQNFPSFRLGMEATFGLIRQWCRAADVVPHGSISKVRLWKNIHAQLLEAIGRAGDSITFLGVTYPLPKNFGGMTAKAWLHWIAEQIPVPVQD